MKKIILMMSIVFLSSAFAVDHSKHHMGHDMGDTKKVSNKKVSKKKSDMSVSQMSIFHLKSKWEDQDGKKFSLKQFEGKPYVIAMAYTSCQHTCPLIVSKMQAVERALPKKLRNKLNYAIFSFDSKRDVPKVLKAYKKRRKLNDKWSLYHGDPSGIRQLAAVLGVNYKEDKAGDFSHSNFISLINKNGVVKEQLTELNQENSLMVEAIKKLF